MTFLFWNIKRRPLQNLIRDVALEHDVDVIALAENDIPLVQLLQTINQSQARIFTEPLNYSRRVSVLSRLPEGSIEPLFDEGTVSIRRVRPVLGREIVLVIAHMHSKLYGEETDVTLNCQRLARDIEATEQQVGHSRTVIVGDLNMNPFERGAVAADALHAVMTRKLAKRAPRTVNGRSRNFFYNPMWARFGERENEPPGTYFYAASTQVSYYWNIYDQVLIRPELLDCFRDEDMKILTKAGATSLLSEKHEPDEKVASDHLPLLFKLNL